MRCGPTARLALLGGVLLAATAADAAAQSRDPVITAPLPIAPPAPEPADAPRQPIGAPVFVPPGPAPYYAAPQTPSGPGYPGPNPPGAGAPGATGPTIGRRDCLQYAPAYDEAGRFLANVCVR